MVMGIFMNIVLGTSLSLITSGYSDTLENNKIEDLIIDKKAESSVVDSERGILSELYETTIGNAIDWGSNILDWLGVIKLDDNNKTYYVSMKENSPITAYIFLIIIFFQTIFNVYLGVVAYRFIKNRSG
jgi:hypothetical protein